MAQSRDPSTPSSRPDRPVRLADLGHRGIEFEIVPGQDALDDLARRLDLLGLRKLRFAGHLRPDGPRDWRLDAQLGATVVQPCRVTLEPVTTRIDEPVVRRYLARWEAPSEAEAEMPGDDTAEPLPETVDLAGVAAEALALALPPFPRAEGAGLDVQAFTEPGKAPLTDDDIKPFAGLAGLRDRLARDDD
jgi:uncharacterized metal-binding protein YceD (DUF177 family)